MFLAERLLPDGESPASINTTRKSLFVKRGLRAAVRNVSSWCVGLGYAGTTGLMNEARTKIFAELDDIEDRLGEVRNTDVYAISEKVFSEMDRHQQDVQLQMLIAISSNSTASRKQLELIKFDGYGRSLEIVEGFSLTRKFLIRGPIREPI
jgi:hypothetical protein